MPKAEKELKIFKKAYQQWRARATQGSRIFCGLEQFGSLSEGYGKIGIVSATYKNGADIRKRLKQDKLLVFTPPKLDVNAMRRIHGNNMREELLEANMETLHAIVLSIATPYLETKYTTV